MGRAGTPHTPGAACHPLVGQHVEVVEAKVDYGVVVVGRTGVIHHDPTFDHDYLSFDDGGSVDPFDEVVVESTASLIAGWREERAARDAAKTAPESRSSKADQ